MSLVTLHHYFPGLRCGDVRVGTPAAVTFTSLVVFWLHSHGRPYLIIPGFVVRSFLFVGLLNSKLMNCLLSFFFRITQERSIGYNLRRRSVGPSTKQDNKEIAATIIAKKRESMLPDGSSSILVKLTAMKK